MIKKFFNKELKEKGHCFLIEEFQLVNVEIRTTEIINLFVKVIRSQQGKLCASESPVWLDQIIPMFN